MWTHSDVMHLACLLFVSCFVFLFFFKQKTAYEMRISDWSSDVCSSDLQQQQRGQQREKGDRQQSRRAQAGGHAPSGTSSAGGGAGTGVALAAQRNCMTSSSMAFTLSTSSISSADRRAAAAMAATRSGWAIDRKSVASGQRWSVRVYLGGRRLIKKQNRIQKQQP